MTETHQRILARLRVKHRGKENAISRKVLAACLDISERSLRKHVSELIQDHGEKIGRDGGIYFCVRESELDANRNIYTAMGAATIKMARAFDRDDRLKEEIQRSLFA